MGKTARAGGWSDSDMAYPRRAFMALADMSYLTPPRFRTKHGISIPGFKIADLIPVRMKKTSALYFPQKSSLFLGVPWRLCG
jgi:hypothetical protein